MAVDRRGLGHTSHTDQPGAQTPWSICSGSLCGQRSGLGGCSVDKSTPVGLTTSVAWILPPPHSVLSHGWPVWFLSVIARTHPDEVILVFALSTPQSICPQIKFSSSASLTSELPG